MNWLREFRKTKKLTQAELADSIGINQCMISKMESGESEPNFYTLVALREVYKININRILDGEVKRVCAETEGDCA